MLFRSKTSIVSEYPRAEGEPYYPIPRPENARLYKRYQQLADAAPNVHFVGRLATYRYYNMDQVVAQALTLARRLLDESRSVAIHTSPAVAAPANACRRRRVGSARIARGRSTEQIRAMTRGPSRSSPAAEEQLSRHEGRDG